MSRKRTLSQGNLRFTGLRNYSLKVTEGTVSLWTLGDFDPAKKTIICLSGWPFSGYTYWPLMQELDIDYQFLGIDIPGFIGYSDIKDFVATAENIAKLLKEIIGQLGISRYALLGTSAGGAYATHFTYTIAQSEKKRNFFARLTNPFPYPDFLILIAPGLHGEKIAFFHTPETTRKVYEEIRKRQNIGDFLQKTITSSVGIRAIKEVFYRRNSQWKEQERIMLLLEEELQRQVKNISTLALLSSGEDLLNSDHTQKLAEIHCPILFVTGSDDNVIPPEETMKASSIPKKGKFSIIEGARHFLIVTHQEKLAKEIEKFVKKL